MNLHLSHFKTAEHLLILSARKRVMAIKKKQCPMPHIRKLFIQSNIAESVHFFDELMIIPATSAFRRVDIRCTGCSTLGSGELDITSIFYFIQSEQKDLAYKRFREWLPLSAARKSLIEAQKLTYEMVKVNLK